MYKAPDIFIPNFFEIDTLPFLKHDSYPLEMSLASQQVQAIRNFTHKHATLMAKIFVYYPKCEKGNSGTMVSYKEYTEERQKYSLMVYSEMPIVTLETLKYMMNDLMSEKRISKEEWNALITAIDMYSNKAHKVIDQLFMSEYQLKLQAPKDSLPLFVYYSTEDSHFRLKTSLKSLSFEISALFDKKKQNLLGDSTTNGFTITNKKIEQKLYAKMNERLSVLHQRMYDSEVLQKFNDKYHKFYEKQTKYTDEEILDLQIRTNIPTLRIKNYIPVSLVDAHDETKLIGPICGNSNPVCMFAHLAGYNANKIPVLQGTSCDRCGVKISQMSRHFILEYIRDSLFNPSQSDVLYCPEFNRFKLLRKYTEVQRTARKLEDLKIEEESKEPIMGENQSSQMDEEQSSLNLNFNEPPHVEVKYHDYMHLKSVLIKTYPLTRNRIKVKPSKPNETVSFTFRLYKKENSVEGFYKNYYRNLELKDPARGKYCQHYQFADLRLFYRNRKKISNGFSFEQFFVCPICGNDIKDSDLIYLKEMTVLIRYLNQQMEDPSKRTDPLEMFGEDEGTKRKAHRSSAEIIISNRERKIYVQYNYEENGEMGRFLNEIEGLYSTMVDPYINFSEYSLGLRRNEKKMKSHFTFDEEEQESDSEQLQKIWFKTPSRSKKF